MKINLTIKLGLGILLAGLREANAADDMARVVLSEHPAAYYRLDEPPGSMSAINLSSSRFAVTGQFQGAALPGVAAYAQGAAVAGPAGISTNSALFSGSANGGFLCVQSSAELSPVGGDGKSAAPFSVECWVQPSPAVAVGSDLRSPLSLAGTTNSMGSTNGAGWDFSEAPGSPARWQFTMRTAQGLVGLVGPNPVKPAQWSHLAATWDGTNAIFFVDGVAAQSTVARGYLAPIGCTATIGACPGANRAAFAGAVSEVAFYTNVLHPNTISNHFVVGMCILSARATTALTPTLQP